jgi:hypothetical protein
MIKGDVLLAGRAVPLVIIRVALRDLPRLHDVLRVLAILVRANTALDRVSLSIDPVHAKIAFSPMLIFVVCIVFKRAILNNRLSARAGIAVSYAINHLNTGPAVMLVSFLCECMD